MDHGKLLSRAPGRAQFLPVRGLPVKIKHILITAVAVTALVAGWVSSPAEAAAAGPDPVATRGYSPEDQNTAVEHWSHDGGQRMKDAGRNERGDSTGPLTKTWPNDDPATRMDTVGKIYFVRPDGIESYCSATSVDSANSDVVITAAHCLFPPGRDRDFVTNLVFVPGSQHNAYPTPHGMFPARQVLLPQEFTEPDFGSAPDFAAIVTSPNASGQHLGQAVGSQHIAFDRNTGHDVHAFGYPMSNPQFGNELLYCEGRTDTLDWMVDTMLVPCDLRAGASGGPWLTDFDPRTRTGTLIGLQSADGNYGGVGEVVTSPLLGPLTEQIHQRASSAP